MSQSPPVIGTELYLQSNKSPCYNKVAGPLALSKDTRLNVLTNKS